MQACASASHNSLILKELDHKILQIAVPSIVSNMTVPLLGLVDTAITGHLGAAAYIAAIAVGTSIFSLCYWVFSFLRMGTGGLTAQAFGRGSWRDCRECLRKSLIIALIAGLGIIALQMVIADVALWLMDTTPEVNRWARVYFHILVWGAPANLALSAFNGWLIGMQDARSPMFIAVGQNVLNIVLSSALVFGFGWKVEGVAAGTLVAQWAGFAAACYFVAKKLKESQDNLAGIDNQGSQATELSAISWGRFFSVNRDIFLRTVCLIAVMFSFTAFGARQGEITLSVNALLMQMFMLVSYVMDGFAYAGEALGGNFLGARDAAGLTSLTRRLFVWGGAMSLLFCMLFVAGGNVIVSILTDNVEVRTAASGFLWAVQLIPLVSMAAFIYDGIFIGTTSTREMLISIAIATLLYFVVALSSETLTAFSTTLPTISLNRNDWLWVGFLIYLGTRGGVQHLLMRKIKARHF